MHDNMKYYSGLSELQDVVVDEIESLAPIEHHELYEKGRKAYNAKNWEKSVEYFEASIKEYTKAYEQCKTLCEVDVEERQQYINGGIYGYHMQLLLCTLDCPRKLSMMFNYPQSSFLSKQFDFLHYSYVQRKYFAYCLAHNELPDFYKFKRDDHLPSFRKTRSSFKAYFRPTRLSLLIFI